MSPCALNISITSPMSTLSTFHTMAIEVVNQHISPPSNNPSLLPYQPNPNNNNNNNAIETKVFYVRLITPQLLNTSIHITFPRRDNPNNMTLLHVNGVEVSPTRDFSMDLNKHGPTDVHVTTNNVWVSGPRLPFEIGVKGDNSRFVVGELRGDECWVMECRDGGWGRVGMVVEVCVIGKRWGGGTPVLMSGAVEVKGGGGNDQDNAIAKELGEEAMKGGGDGLGDISDYKFKEEPTSEEEEEISLFGAGVRVGMGIGLGMSLGIGVGVGLAIRTYQATFGAFKRLV